ncbi:MAG TPA: hypothetical protein VMZ31_12735 [Phycisphaerae bacterium]|nr:hypothetical protein [Phycisphaerae bacterium]
MFRVITLPGLIVLITFIAIAVVVAVIFVKVVAAVLRGLVGMFGAMFGEPDTDHVGRAGADPPAPPAAPVRTCANPRCRFPNKPEARYCAMCGQQLS